MRRGIGRQGTAYAKPPVGQVRGPHTRHAPETEKSLAQLKHHSEKGKQDQLFRAPEAVLHDLDFIQKKSKEPLKDFK